MPSYALQQCSFTWQTADQKPRNVVGGKKVRTELFWKNLQRQKVIQTTIESWRGQLTSTKTWTLNYPDSASMASASLILVALTMASCRSMSACVTVVDDMRGWSGFKNEARSSLPWKLKSRKKIICGFNANCGDPNYVHPKSGNIRKPNFWCSEFRSVACVWYVGSAHISANWQTFSVWYVGSAHISANRQTFKQSGGNMAMQCSFKKPVASDPSQSQRQCNLLTFMEHFNIC